MAVSEGKKTVRVEQHERVVVRFAGDSGDGMQLAGSRFTDATAAQGNDLATLPDFPAEIRAPAGTIGGVSAFQIHFASRDILTPGEKPNVLVLDEPTTHLDYVSVELLEAALPDFPGTLLLVTHDRYLQERTTARGLEL